jgi:hypothetical protein
VEFWYFERLCPRANVASCSTHWAALARPCALALGLVHVISPSNSHHFMTLFSVEFFKRKTCFPETRKSTKTSIHASCEHRGSTTKCSPEHTASVQIAMCSYLSCADGSGLFCLERVSIRFLVSESRLARSHHRTPGASAR